MRSKHVVFAVSLASLCVVAPACKVSDPIHLEPTIEDAPALASSLRFTDPVMAGQLVQGFFDLQGGAWRWTAPQFEVLLGPPAGAVSRGARLVLDFTLPDPSIASLKTMTVTANVNHLPLPPDTYTTAGQHQYVRDVPASAFVSQEIAVQFSCDKFLVPPNDGRRLALIVTGVALEPK